MTLADAKLGEIVEVEAVHGERGFRRRLMELGLVPKTRVTFLGVAPLGDPVHLLVRGSQLSIRRNEAAQIRVRAEETVGVTSPLLQGRAVSA
jgi:Fe2+ transport system protein FeoA